MAGDGDFLAILRFVGKVVQWLLELMLDLICVCLLVLPMALPWRFVALCCSAADACERKGLSPRSAFRSWAASHFGVALIDIFVIPFVIISCISPLRWYLLVAGTVRGLSEPIHDEDAKRISYHAEVRFFWFTQCFQSIFDVFCLIFGIIAVIHPWRTYETLKGVISIAMEPAALLRQKGLRYEEYGSFDGFVRQRQSNFLSPLRWWFLQCGAMCFVDWPALLFGVCSILMPTRTVSFFRCLCHILRDGNKHSGYPEFSFHYSMRSASSFTVTFRTVDWPTLWCMCAAYFASALLDLATLPFTILALLSPIRFYRLVEDVYLRSSGSPPKCKLIFKTLSQPTSPVEFSSCQRTEVVLRKTWKRQGGAHVYKGSTNDDGRQLEVRAFVQEVDKESGYTPWHITTRDKNSGEEENIVVYSILEGAPKKFGTSRSPSDVLTWSGRDANINMLAEWGFGGEPIDIFELGHPYNQGLRLACVRNGAQSLADVIFLPFMFLVIISVYRARPLLTAISNVAQHKKTDEFDGFASKVRGVRTETLRQCLLLILDVVTAPGLLIVALTGYRTRGLLNNMGSHFDHFNCNLHQVIIKNTLIVLHDGILLLPSLLLLFTFWRSGSIWRVCGSLIPERPHRSSNDTDADIELLQDREEEEEDGAAVARRQLAELDPQWGALAGVEPELETLATPDADLLSLPTLLQESEFPGTIRPMIWVEFLKLLRDLLILPFFLLTLHRLPAVLIKLCARAGKPVGGDPRFHVERTRVAVIDRVGVSIELSVSGSDELKLDKSSLKIRPMGKDFWNQVAAAFGSNAAAIGQGMMPLTIKAAQTDAYEILAAPASTDAEAPASTDAEAGGQDVRTFTMRIESKVKRATVEKSLRKLGGAPLRVQLEASCKGKKFLLAVSNVRVSDMVAATVESPQQGSFVEMPRRTENVEIGEHVTMQEAYWTIVGMEFAQVMLDLFHLLLLVPIIVLPWRFVRFVICIFEPKERWPLRVSAKALRDLRDAEWLLDRFRAHFVPRCNELLKDQSIAKQWHMGRRPLEMRSRELTEHAALTRSILGAADELHPEIQQPLQHCVELQDARLYHVALRAYAHCALSQSELTMEEHATIVDEITTTESRLAAVQERAISSLEDQVKEAREEAYQRGWKKCGFWRKDVGLLRKIIRSIAATSDLLGIMFFGLLIVTVYRLPSACAELTRERAWNPFSKRFRLILKLHLKAFAEEVALALTVLLIFAALVVTLVRLPDAVRSLGRSSSLRDMRDNLLDDLKDAMSSLCELLSLFTLWRTYSFLFRAVAQSILVAPACITEMIGTFCDCLPLGVRFVSGVLVIAGLYVFAFIGTSSQIAFFIGMAVIVVGSCGAISRKEGEAEIKGWSSPTLRWTWSNFFALGAVVIEPVFIILALSTFPSAEHNQADSESPFFGTTTRDAVCDMTAPLVVVAGSVTGVWLLLLSLMFVTGQLPEHAKLQSHGLLRFLQLLLSHVLLMPVCICLLLPVACEDSSLRGISLCFFACYVCTTQALSTECGLLEPAPESGGLDLRYPLKYISLAQALNIGVCIASTWNGSIDVVFALVFATLSLFHLALYPCLRRSQICCVPYVVLLRAGGAFAVFASALFVVHQRYISAPLHSSVMHFTWLGLFCITFLGALTLGLYDRWSRWRELRDSGVIQECRRLIAETEEALCHSEIVLSPNREFLEQRWQKKISSATSAETLALQLLEIEKHILVEWLTFDFLEERKKWCQSLLEARNFPELRRSIFLLRAGIRTPPTQDRMLQCVSKALKRADLSEKVVAFVIGHPELKALLQPALFCAKTSKKIGKRCGCCAKGGNVQMSVHFEFAQKALRETIQRFKATSCAKQFVGVTPVQTGDSFLNVLMEPSHPQMYYEHLGRMLSSAGRVFDTYGEPHVTLPRGLVVGRALPLARGNATPKRLRTGTKSGILEARSSSSIGTPTQVQSHSLARASDEGTKSGILEARSSSSIGTPTEVQSHSLAPASDEGVVDSYTVIPSEEKLTEPTALQVRTMTTRPSSIADREGIAQLNQV